MKTKGLWIGMLLLLVIAPAAFAQGPTPGTDGGQIFRDQNVSLQSGEVFDGDMGILNGDLDMPADSTVRGDVFITNGDATIRGRVEGNVAVISGHLDLAQSGWVKGDVFATGGSHEVAGQVGGNLSLLFGNLKMRSTALVEGDLLVAPGKVEKEEGAQVRGNEVQNLRVPRFGFQPESSPVAPRLTIPPVTQVPEVMPLPEKQGAFGHRFGRLVGRTLTAMFLGVLLIAVGALIAAIWPRATRQVADCIGAMPVQSFGLGLITFLLAAGLEALAVVVMILIILVSALLIGTVILIPIGLLLLLLSGLVLLPVPLGLAGGMVLGWVSLADLLGKKILQLLRVRSSTPLGATLVGLMITGSVAALLWIIKPVCCGWPFVVLMTSIGLGAVFHTRFGTQPCRSAGVASAADELLPETTPSEAGALMPTDAVLSPAVELLPSEDMEMEAGQPDIPAAGTP